jgi:RNA-directed DNA polymerase
MSSSLYKQAQYKKYEFKKLCHLLGFGQVEIQKLLEGVDKNYREWSEDKLDKNGNPKKYPNGTIKTRTFRNPSVLLKAVQKRIKKNILDKELLPNCVHGGVKGRSNITNAKQHQGKKYKLETDLQEFYPNISMRRVYDLFLSFGYSTHIAHWLTKLSTRKDELPQGSPASTGIANLIFRQTDYKLLGVCKDSEITYTRYIDDLTFSSSQDFSSLVFKILSIVIEADFKINRRKTKYEGGLPVTGLDVFLHKIDAPQHIIDKSSNEIATDAMKKPYTQYVNRVRKTNSRKKRKGL